DLRVLVVERDRSVGAEAAELAARDLPGRRLAEHADDRTSKAVLAVGGVVDVAGHGRLLLATGVGVVVELVGQRAGAKLVVVVVARAKTIVAGTGEVHVLLVRRGRGRA